MPADANPVYGGPYLDQHVPDPDVPLSFVSAAIGTNTVADGENASGNRDLNAGDTASAAALSAAETTEEALLVNTVSDDPSDPGFVPQTDSTEHL